MIYTYRFHPHTKKDFDEAYIWYEDKQEGLGERFLLAIRAKLQKIALHPEAKEARLLERRKLRFFHI